MKKILLIICSLLVFSGCNKKDNQNKITTIIENNNTILIGINYPITNIKKLDRIIKSDVEKIYNSFKNEYENFNSLNEKAELNIDYTFNKINQYYLISIDTYINSSKLSKANNTIKTYIYDTRKNKLLALKDVIPKEDLNYITKYSKKELIEENKECINLDKIKSLLTPDYKTYQNFTFDQNYLYLYFDSNQIGSNCNMIKTKIPLDYLNPKIDIYQDIVKTINTKIKIPSKTLDPTQKFIALTFDDGPSIYTKDIIDILKKNDCNATFFVLGNKVEIYKDTLRESLKNGNEIGNHSYSHKWLIKLDEESLKEQIYKTQDIIKETTGYTPTLLRPTYGSVNNKIKSLSDFKIVLWNVDTLDWKYKSVDCIVSRATKNAKDGNIILMHDIHARTVKALEKIIPILKEEGYELITISEMEEINLLRSKMKTDH